MPTSKDPAKASAGLQEAREAVRDMIGEIRNLSVANEASKLFPYGITEVSVALTVAGVQLSIEISGPDGPAKPGADNQPPSLDPR